MKTKVSEASGPTLDWMVAKAKGHAEFVLDAKRFIDMHYTGHHNYSTNPAQAYPIIYREIIDVNGDPNGKGVWQGRCFVNGKQTIRMYGSTPLIAALRCFVASKLGDEVEVPEELK